MPKIKNFVLKLFTWTFFILAAILLIAGTLLVIPLVALLSIVVIAFGGLGLLLLCAATWCDDRELIKVPIRVHITTTTVKTESSETEQEDNKQEDKES